MQSAGSSCFVEDSLEDSIEEAIIEDKKEFYDPIIDDEEIEPILTPPKESPTLRKRINTTLTLRNPLFKNKKKRDIIIENTNRGNKKQKYCSLRFTYSNTQYKDSTSN